MVYNALWNNRGKNKERKNMSDIFRIGDRFCYPLDLQHKQRIICDIPKEVADLWLDSKRINVEKYDLNHWMNKLAICVHLTTSTSIWVYNHDGHYYLLEGPIERTATVSNNLE